MTSACRIVSMELFMSWTENTYFWLVGRCALKLYLSTPQTKLWNLSECKLNKTAGYQQKERKENICCIIAAWLSGDDDSVWQNEMKCKSYTSKNTVWSVMLRGFGVTGDVEVNELTSLQRTAGNIWLIQTSTYIHRFSQWLHARCVQTHTHFTHSDIQKLSVRDSLCLLSSALQR